MAKSKPKPKPKPKTAPAETVWVKDTVNQVGGINYPSHLAEVGGPATESREYTDGHFEVNPKDLPAVLACGRQPGAKRGRFQRAEGPPEK